MLINMNYVYAHIYPYIRDPYVYIYFMYIHLFSDPHLYIYVYMYRSVKRWELYIERISAFQALDRCLYTQVYT
jgi:hypothetical protein